MASTFDNHSASDTEKPVREQLQKASISKSIPGDSVMAGTDDTEETVRDTKENVGGTQGEAAPLQHSSSPTTKMSFEEVVAQQPEQASQAAKHHSRKRSREISVDDEDYEEQKSDTSSEEIDDQEPQQVSQPAEHHSRKRSRDNSAEIEENEEGKNKTSLEKIDNQLSEQALEPVKHHSRKRSWDSTAEDTEYDGKSKPLLEEVDDQSSKQASQPVKHHSRKRSRDSTAEDAEYYEEKSKASLETGQGAAEPPVESNGEARTSLDKRPTTPDPTGQIRGEVAVEEMASPKTKRSRLHSATAAESEPVAPNTLPTDAENGTSTEKMDEKKAAETKSASGFSDTSAASPFSSVSKPKSPPAEMAQTTPSAFAASGFSALSGSSTSGFGAIGKSSGGFGAGGTFATGSKSPPSKSPSIESKSPKAVSGSTFGGALGQQSAFGNAGSAASGFGSTSGSAFGSTLGSAGGIGGGFSKGGFASSGFGSLSGAAAGGLTSFASGKPSAALAGSSKLAKPFGAPADDEDGENGEEQGDEGDETGLRSPLSQESDKQDERFYEQELETGEEAESTAYSCRAKLYNFSGVGDGKREWKERGLGVVRLNVKKASDDSGDGDDDEENTKPRARLLMRAEGSHRVILNTPIKKEIKFGAPDGSEPKGGYMYFMGAVDGRTNLELLQLKARQQFAQELWDKISELQKAM